MSYQVYRIGKNPDDLYCYSCSTAVTIDDGRCPSCNILFRSLKRHCLNCDELNDIDTKICSCGYIYNDCPECFRRQDPDATFCRYCGVEIHPEIHPPEIKIIHYCDKCNREFDNSLNYCDVDGNRLIQKEIQIYCKELDTEKIYGKILGLKGKVGINDIDKAYRKIIKKYHPDKVAALGDELREIAEKQTKKINEAYEYFKKKYY
jgi:hypothetical protein